MNNSLNSTLIILIRIAVAAILVIKMFQLMHWPGGNVARPLQALAVGAILIGYSIRFFLKKHKVQLDFIKALMVVFWALTYVLPDVLYPAKEVCAIISFLCFAYWFITGGFLQMIGKENVKGSSTRVAVFFIPAVLTILLGGMFKIMHWPGASLMLVLGLVGSAIGLIIGTIKGKTKRANKEVVLFLIPTAFLVVIGAMFKLMHWPGSSLMLVLGFSYAAIGVLIGIFIKSDIEPEKKFGTGRKVIAVVIIGLGAFVLVATGGRFLSNNLLDDFVQLEKSIDNQIVFVRSQELDKMYDLLLSDPTLASEIGQIKDAAQEAINTIEKNKSDILELANGGMGDQYVAVQYFIVHEDGQHGRDLINSIDNFKTLIKPIFSDSLATKILDTQMSTSEITLEEGFRITWISQLSEHLPVAAVISNLTLWQSHIQNAEIIALDEILKEEQINQ